MKKNGILNSEISKVLSDLGHTDQITISDCGLPVPDGVKKIDLALKFGTPSFLDTFETVLMDMKVEKIILAEEIKSASRVVYDEVNRLLEEGVEVEYVPHEELKELVKQTKAVIRTGERTPFANVIMQSGVIF